MEKSSAPAKGKLRGFKLWLEQQGKQDESAPRKKPGNAPKPAKRPAAAAAVTKRPVSPVAAAPIAENEVSCALFNNGKLLISNGTSVINLTKAQARQVVAYLELIASALQE